MTKQEFRELEKKLFAAFVEYVKPTNQRIEIREVHIGEKITNILYIPDINTEIEGSFEKMDFTFISGQYTLSARISVDTKSTGNFISEAKKMFVTFLESARDIRNAKRRLAFMESGVNGYPF